MSKFIEEHLFEFDKCFDELSTNHEVYLEVVQPLIKEAFCQIKITCFSYGQTGSGKTFTMMGNEANNVSLDENTGLIILAAHDIFSYLCLDQFSHLEVYVSFYEIYCEKIFDLLNDRNPVLPLEDKNNTVNLKNLTEQQVWDHSDLTKVVKKGIKARTVGVTGANSDSSRSHALIEINIREPEGNNFTKIVFVDLAGTERAVDVIETNKQTKFDTGKINEGLFGLKECIRALRANSNYIPFRKNTLTFVLKDYFCSIKTKMVMITNITPTLSSVEYTLNSLRYAKMLKNDKVDETTIKYDVYEKISQTNKIPAVNKEENIKNPYSITSRYLPVNENTEKNNSNNQQIKTQNSKSIITNNSNQNNANNNLKVYSNNNLNQEDNNIKSNNPKKLKKNEKKLNEAAISDLLKKAENKNSNNTLNLNNKLQNANKKNDTNINNMETQYMNTTTSNFNSVDNVNNKQNNLINLNKSNSINVCIINDESNVNPNCSDNDLYNSYHNNLSNSINNINHIQYPYSQYFYANENLSNQNFNNINNLNETNKINNNNQLLIINNHQNNQNGNIKNASNIISQNNLWENNYSLYNTSNENNYCLEKPGNIANLNKTFNFIENNNNQLLDKEYLEEDELNNTQSHHYNRNSYSTNNNCNTEQKNYENEYQRIYELLELKKKLYQDQYFLYIQRREEFHKSHLLELEKLAKKDQSADFDFIESIIDLEYNCSQEIYQFMNEIRELEKRKLELAKKINEFRYIFSN